MGAMIWERLGKSALKKLMRRGMYVTDSKIPEPDGQFRLRPCKKCSDEAPVYIKLRERNEELWRVCCLGCFTKTEGYSAQHDAQIEWNTHLAEAPEIRRAI